MSQHAQPRRVGFWLKRIGKIFALTVATIILLLALGLFGAAFYFTEPRVIALLKAQVEKQTGGELQLESVEFSFWRGVTFRNIALLLPVARNGVTQTEELFAATAVNVHYDLRKLFLLTLQVDALNLEDPRLKLLEEDGVSALTSLTEYRKQHFPPAPKIEVETKPSPPKAKLKDYLPIDPMTFALPIRLDINRVGFSGLKIEMAIKKKGEMIQTIALDGLSLNLAVHGVGAWSKAELSVLGGKSADGELTARYQAVGGEKKKRIKKEYQIRTDLDLRLAIENLSNITESLKVAVKELRANGNTLAPINFAQSLSMAMTKGWQNFELQSVKLEALDAVYVDIAAEATTDSDLLREALVTPKIKVAANLDQLQTIVKQFAPDLSFGGKITLNSNEVSIKHETGRVPALIGGELHLKLEKLRLIDSAHGLSVKDISMTTEIKNTGGLDGAVDLANTLSIAGIAAQKSGKGVALSNIGMQIQAHAALKEQKVNHVGLDLRVAEIAADAGQGRKIALPLTLKVVGKEISKTYLDQAQLALDAGDALHIAANGGCGSSCDAMQGGVQIRTPNLSQIYTLVTPFIPTTLPRNILPTKLSGAINLDVKAKAKAPMGPLSDVTMWLESGDLDFTSQLAVRNVDVAIPLNQLAIEKLNEVLTITGGLRQQTLVNNLEFSALSLLLPRNESGEAKNVNLTKLVSKVEIRNKLESDLDQTKPQKSLDVALNTSLSVAEAKVSGKKMQSFGAVNLQAVVNALKGERVDLSKLHLSIPGLGAELDATGQTNLDEKMQPVTSKAHVALGMDATKIAGFTAGLKTKGAMQMSADAEVKGLRDVTFGGQINFDHFTFAMLDDLEKPTLEIEDIHGQIPLKQHLILPESKPILQPDSSSGAVETPPEDLTTLTSKYLADTENIMLQSANVASLIDYQGVKPLFAGRKPIGIKKIEVANLMLANAELDLEMKQNWIAINQFVFEFLEGKLQGSLQLALDPRPRALRLALHFSRLNTYKLIERFENLKDKAQGWSLFTDPYLDGTAHLTYDLLSGDIQGALEIASMGKEQLRMILYYVDPEEKNASIKQIRTALNFGEIKRVSIPIKNGLMGLDVDLRLLGAPIPLPKIARFPIAEMIKNTQSKKAVAKEGAVEPVTTNSVLRKVTKEEEL